MAALRLVTALGPLLLFAACSGGGNEPDFSVPGDYPYPVQTPLQLTDRSHLAQGVTYDGYTSDPPTSGPHAPAPAPWGISQQVLSKEVPVHNMEHAGAVVWYNCNADPPLTTGECATLQNELAAVVTAALNRGKRVLMTPYPSMEHRIALTTWGFLDTFDEFDAARVESFIDTFECNYDPENFC